MKIALFTETYLPDINGVSTHLYTLKTGLEQTGHEVMVVTADKTAKNHYLEDGVLYCPSVESKKFYGFGIAPPISLQRYSYIDDFDPDIVHIHHEFGIGLSGLIYANMNHKPLFYTLHTMYDMYVHYVAGDAFSKVATKFSHKYENFVARNATALACPSRKGEAYFNRIGVVDKPFYLIPNSAEMEEFDPFRFSDQELEALREEIGIPKNKTIACFVGRLGQEKSVDVLLDFWAESLRNERNLHLMIIGTGPDGEALQEQAKTLGIADHVTFTGRVEHDVISAYFAICDAYITASLSEMNSISMLEGMASGLPTIQRFDELNAEQIVEGTNGYFFHDGLEMGEHLKRIGALSPEEKQALKTQVRGSIHGRDMKGLATRMMEIYSEVIALYNRVGLKE